MTSNDRKAIAKELRQLIGERVELTLKTIVMLDVINMNGEEKLQMKNIIQGYIIAVSPYFIYMGENPDSGYTDLIEIEQVGRYGIISDEEVINLTHDSDGAIH